MREFHGRRLRCDGCGERVAEPDAWDHYLKCRSTLAWPYYPDTHPDVEDTTQADLEAF